MIRGFDKAIQTKSNKVTVEEAFANFEKNTMNAKRLDDFIEE